MNSHQSRTFPPHPRYPLERQEHDEPPRVGVAFTPFETRADLILRMGSQAEELGLDRVDLAEGRTHDSMILLAQLAARTHSIGLGTAVISAWDAHRPPSPSARPVFNAAAKVVSRSGSARAAHH